MKRKPFPKSYAVGYKKPPTHTQFKKGASGNPKGRPKGTKNLKTDLQEEVNEMIQITESGNIRSISKQRAILKRAVAKALNGDARATELVMKLIAAHLNNEEGEKDLDQLLSEDAAILNRFVKQRVRQKTALPVNKQSGGK